MAKNFLGATDFDGTATFAVPPAFTDQSGTRMALGLGTAATYGTGTSGANVPLLNGANTWSALQTFTTISAFSVNLSSALKLDPTSVVGGSDGYLWWDAGDDTFKANYAGAARIIWNSGNQLALGTTDSSARTALGLGTAATQNTGTSGATVPLLNANNTHSGTNTFSSVFTLAHAQYDTSVHSPSAWSTSQNNFAVNASARVLRMSGTAARNLTGIAASGAGRRLLLCNIGSFTVTLMHQDAASSAANRFFCPGGVNFPVNPNDNVEVWYDTDSSGWRVIAF